MDQSVLARLSSLSPLGEANSPPLDCKICGAIAPAFDVVDFNKMCSETNPYEFGHAGIAVWYYRCSQCGFMFTDFCDSWSTEKFSSFIYNDDYVKVDGDYIEARPRRDALFILEMLSAWDNFSLLDYGGGAGVLAAVLREHGIDAASYDPFSSPERPKRTFDLITCMEVIEHSADPVGTLRDMASLLEPGGCMLVGTGIQPADIETLRANWWYAAPRNGHISLQSATSLAPLGRAAGLTAYRSGYLHGFAANPSPRSIALLERVGRLTIELVLSAPDASGGVGPGLRTDDACWHYMENHRWRWTAQDEVRWVWSPLHPQCDVRFKIPYLFEIAVQIAAGSRLYIGDENVPLQIRSGHLIGDYAVHGASDLIIRLVTPPGLVPHEIAGSDDFRRLGLAVMVHGAE